MEVIFSKKKCKMLSLPPQEREVLDKLPKKRKLCITPVNNKRFKTSFDVKNVDVTSDRFVAKGLKKNNLF